MNISDVILIGIAGVGALYFFNVNGFKDGIDAMITGFLSVSHGDCGPGEIYSNGRCIGELGPCIDVLPNLQCPYHHPVEHQRSNPELSTRLCCLS